MDYGGGDEGGGGGGVGVGQEVLVHRRRRGFVRWLGSLDEIVHAKGSQAVPPLDSATNGSKLGLKDADEKMESDNNSSNKVNLDDDHESSSSNNNCNKSNNNSTGWVLRTAEELTSGNKNESTRKLTWAGIELSKPVIFGGITLSDGLFYVPLQFVEAYYKGNHAATLIQALVRRRRAAKVTNSLVASKTWNVLDNLNEELGLKRGKAMAKAQHRRSKAADAMSGASEALDSGHVSTTNVQQQQQQQQQQGKSAAGLGTDPLVGGGVQNIQESEPHDPNAMPSKDKVEHSDNGLDIGMKATNERTMDVDVDVDDAVDNALTAAERQLALSEKEVNELTERSLDSIKISKSYGGPHLRFPLRADDVWNMMEEFKHGEVLHYKYIMHLFLLCRQILAQESTVQEINLPKPSDHPNQENQQQGQDNDATLTIVGDIHGQLQDLYSIFSIKGLPSEKNWFLFNGDFVDRGRNGCEVLATMCAMKILYPKYVFMNRGNHESRAQNTWMGFEEEIINKYARKEDVIVRGDSRSPLRIHILCESMFDMLPLCALIQRRVFVCHGGLFRNDGVTLSQLRNVNRKREPPLEGQSIEDRIFEDILWSDPRPTSMFPGELEDRRSSERGAGCEFGIKVTTSFCATNQVALIVRSHECVNEGYEVLHDGRLITIFSASRYCGTQTNKGAFITLGASLQPEIQQFFAQEDNLTSFLSDEERLKRLEDDALHMIIEQICDKRLDLFWYFTKNERGSTPTGKVTRVEWANALQNVLGLDLPFLHYQPRLAELENDSMINYPRFLSRFQIHVREADSSWQEGIVQRICEKLYSVCGADLEEAYRRFDLDESGVVDYGEFVETLKALDVGLNDQQIFEFMRSVDVDDNACIDFKEFAARFQVAFDTIAEKTRTKQREQRQEREQQQAVSNTDATPGSPASPPKRFMGAESSSSVAASGAAADGKLSDVSRLQRDSSLSRNGDSPFGSSGSLQRLDTDAEALNVALLRPLTPRNEFVRLDWSEMDSWTLECLRTISRKMYLTDKMLPVAFRRMSHSKSYIEENDFVQALKAYGLQFSDADAAKLFRTVDANSSGRLNYMEFVEAFQVTDHNPLSESWQQGIVQQVANVLYQNRIHLRHAFRVMDADCSGKISAEEFQAGMQSINNMLDHPLSPFQIEELRRSLDKDGNGQIDYKEFFDGLNIFDSEKLEQPHLIRKSSSFYMDVSSSNSVGSDAELPTPPAKMRATSSSTKSFPVPSSVSEHHSLGTKTKTKTKTGDGGDEEDDEDEAAMDLT